MSFRVKFEQMWKAEIDRDIESGKDMTKFFDWLNGVCNNVTEYSKTVKHPYVRILIQHSVVIPKQMCLYFYTKAGEAK